QGALDDPVVLPRARALGVLRLRDAEEDDGPNAYPRELTGLADELVDRALRDRVEALDRAHHSFARAGEERHDHVVEGQRGLADERSQRVCAPKATEPSGGKAHGPKRTRADASGHAA